MAPSAAMEILGQVAFEYIKIRPLLPTYFHLLISALFPIYTAAHSSLARPPSAASPKKAQSLRGRAKGDDGDDDEGDDEVVQKIESLSAWDALTFPLLAGATLTSLYFLIKYLQDPALLNKILGLYFSQIGLFFGIKFLKDVLSTARSVLLPSQYSAGHCLWLLNNDEECFEALCASNEQLKSRSPFPGVFRHLPLPRWLSSLIWQLRKILYAKASLRLHVHKVVTIKTPLDVLDLISLAVTTGIVVYHTVVSKPWYLTNFLGFSFCYGSLQIVTPTTVSTGTLLLCALFFYDIYFVFFTPMMVTVATKLDVPIKLLFPRPDGCVLPLGAPEGSSAMQEYLECVAKKRTMAMLGLGDIVIPGMILAFALRFDLYLYYLRLGKTNARGKSEKSLVTLDKPKYTPATGGWGERFWTSRKYRSNKLKAKRFPKTYFHATVLGYLVGMIATLVVMQVAQHAQPALLYLVPGVLISLWGTALVRGELKILWQYTEAAEDEKDEKGENKGENKKKEKVVENGKGMTTRAKASSGQAINDNTARDAIVINSDDHKPAIKPNSSAEVKAQSNKSEVSPRELFSFSITLLPSSSTHNLSDKSHHHRRSSLARIPVMQPHNPASLTASPEQTHTHTHSHPNNTTAKTAVSLDSDSEDDEDDIIEISPSSQPIPITAAPTKRSLRKKTSKGKIIVTNESDFDDASVREPQVKRRRRG